MKRTILLLIGLIVSALSAFCQQQDTSGVSVWEFSAEANAYFFSDDFIFLPVFRADKEHLHLEARYNYEDEKTASTWVGYNFIGGKKFQYAITPMFGGIFGRTNGVAPGLEVTLSYKDFEFYSESEYLFDLRSRTNNFFYSWADLSYAPLDWLWFGISGQRTKLYHTGLDIERGFFVGTGFKNLEFTGYLYNIGFSNTFVLIAASASF